MANYDLTYEGSRVQNILDTGDELRDAGYIFRGEATPSTVPGTPTERVAYIGGPGTYTNFGSTLVVPMGGIGVFKYNGTGWNNYAIVPGIGDGGVFDLSAYNAQGSTLATYADLSAALTALNSVPANYKKGGMTMKFILTVSGIYVQYRLLSADFNINPANWVNVNIDIANEKTAREEADNTLQGNIDSEAAARADADRELQSNIDTVQTNLNNEEDAREGADTTLQNNINSEATTRQNADASLQSQINNEIAARRSADATLQNNINSEAAARQNADAALQNDIDEFEGTIRTQIDEYRPIEITGDVTNAPDEEDLTSVDQGGTDVLKFKDRNNLYGMGMIIMRRDKTFSEQLTQTNTIYVIRYDFELDADVTIPANCVLQFDGGSISGEHTITGNNTGIEAGLVKIFSSSIIIAGTWDIKKAYIEWFGAKGDGITDDSDCIVACLPFKNIELQSKTYLIKMVDITTDNVHIWGIGNSTVYNDEWGPWCFRTSNNYIEIDHINFKAIPHTEVLRTYPGDEQDNGASAVLSKGSYCKYHDLYIEEFYNGIWLGGDYATEYGESNEVYNINVHHINFNTFAAQKNLVIYNIYGDCGTFSNTGDGYSGGGYVDADGNERASKPSHLVYITSISSIPYSINVSVYGIICTKATGGGSAIAVKGVKDSNISDITIQNGIILQSNWNENVLYKSLRSFACDVDGEYVMNIRSSINCTFDNVIIKNGNAVSTFRISENSQSLLIRDSLISSNIPLTHRLIFTEGSDNIVFENCKIIGIVNSNTDNAISAGTNLCFKNCIFDGDENIKFVNNKNNVTIIGNEFPTIPSGYKKLIINNTSYQDCDFIEELSDRNNVLISRHHYKNNYIEISNDKQITCSFNNITFENIAFIILNSGTSTIYVRFTDISGTIHKNNDINWQAGYPLGAGNAIKVEIIKRNTHTFIILTELNN